MLRSPWVRLVFLLVVASLTTGCLLLFENGGFQSISLHFTIDREIPADEVFDVEVLVHPVEIGIRRRFAQLSGMLMAPEGEPLPESVLLAVVTENEAGRQVDRIRKTVRVREDGGFLETQRVRRDIPAGAMQAISIEPQGVAIPRGTKLFLCLDIVEKRGDLAALVDCSAGEAPGTLETVMVEVVDNAFRPPRAQIEPGQTVRWVFAGSNTSHSVTSADPTQFDSGFIFRTPGDFFEVTFGAETANEDFDYFCRTHQNLQMVGTIEVGG
jgi:plastocyanin